MLSRASIALIAGCAIALGAGYACESDRAVGPPHRILGDLDPVPPESGAVLGSYTLTTPAENNIETPWQSTGITLPAGVPVRVTVSGHLQFTSNPGYTQCWGHPPPALPGQVGPLGLPPPDAGQYAVEVGKSSSGSPPGGHFSVQGNADSIWTFTGGPGVLWADRASVYPIACGVYNTPGYQPGYFVSGSQTLVATVMPQPVINVDRTTVVNGDTIAAQVAVSWTSSIDLYYAYWQWVADTGATGGGATFVSGSGCGPNLTCRVIVHGDGHLEVPNVYVGGMYLTAVSPTIHVAPAHLTLTVDSSHVASGSQVKFTAHRGDARPVQVQSWVWTPGSTSPVGPLGAECAGGDSVCATVIQNTSPPDSTGVGQTGTMTAVAYLGTAAESASAAVTVDPPRPGGSCGTAPISAASMGPSRSAVRTARRLSATTLVPLHGRIRQAPTGKRAARMSPSGTTVLAGQMIPMTCQPPPGGDTAIFTLTVDKVTLSPRILADSVNGIWDPGRQPDTTNVTANVTSGGRGVSGASVWFSAAFLPNTGGHAHVNSPLRFEDTPPATTGPEAGKPLVGYFLSGTQKVSYIGVTTDSTGTVSVKVVAGYLGGQARVSATVSAPATGQATTRTATLSYAVPGLVTLKGIVPDSVVYWIGGTDQHPQGVNFYVQDSIKSRLTPIADSLLKTVGTENLFSQFNDATLVNGGTFTVSPKGWIFEDPYNAVGGHLAHNNGLDIDIGLCYVAHNGDDDKRTDCATARAPTTLPTPLTRMQSRTSQPVITGWLKLMVRR